MWEWETRAQAGNNSKDGGEPNAKSKNKHQVGQDGTA